MNSPERQPSQMKRRQELRVRGTPVNIPTVTITIGGVHASREPIVVKTILGSCIAACLGDPTTRIGGMNHFLLPGDLQDQDMSTRYGINAMEVLINEMMRLGANRHSLRAKLFGGADIFQANHSLLSVGEKNIRFIREFLRTERIPVENEHLGGNDGVIVLFRTDTFEAWVKRVRSDRFRLTETEEIRYRDRITRELMTQRESDITLF